MLIGQGHPLANGLSLEIVCPVGTKDELSLVNIPIRLVPKAPGHIWEQFILPNYVRGGLLSLCNTGPLAVSKQVVCIHDVNTRVVPESYGFKFRAVYRILIPALARRAAQIVTVSRFSQKTMTRFGIAPSEKIAVIHDGYEHILDWSADRSLLNGADLPQPFVLLVGSKAPHKNVAVIYAIAQDLAAKGISVLVTGGEDANVYAHEHSHPLPPTVRHLGRVNDNDLAFLYRHALCLVFPSKTEGFGLPALEAMALGCPVISSDAGSLPEVCADAVLYAPPDDAAAWLAAIVRISIETLLRERLSGAGPTRAKTFSWRKGAEKYLELMYALDHGTGHRGPSQLTPNGAGMRSDFGGNADERGRQP